MHFEMFGASVLVGLMSGWLAGIAMKGGGWDALGHHLRSQRELRGELDLPNPGGAVVMITLQRKIWPAQVAHA
jgi:hypothetical protein